MVHLKVLNKSHNPDIKGMFEIPFELYNKLFTYQLKGLIWLWKLYCAKIGAILADDMGLGKTVTMCSFLCGIMGVWRLKKVIIIVPYSVLDSWKNHIKHWTSVNKTVFVHEFHGNTDKKLNILTKFNSTDVKSCDVLITTFDTVRASSHILQKCEFEYCIIDEGHKCKNPYSQQSEAIRQLRVKNGNRIMCTGTFMQNKMEELWALIDWCTEGRILNTYSH
eukprot:UN24043